MTYKFIPHTADIKFIASGNSLEEAFSESAYALKEAIAKDSAISAKIKKEISVYGNDLENLLYLFLEEFLFILDANSLVLSRIEKIKIDTEKLKLNALVLLDDAKKYKISNNVKAVTYNEMFVKQEKGKWIVQAVLDV